MGRVNELSVHLHFTLLTSHQDTPKGVPLVLSKEILRKARLASACSFRLVPVRAAIVNSPYLGAVVPFKGLGAVGLPAVHAPCVLVRG